jgi:hypothetical protein
MGYQANELPLNPGRALIMHIDLNSCFAIVEQQANPLYRKKPVAVAAYDTPRGMVIASSYEAKSKGIKLGVNVGEARQIDPNVIVLMPDPAKYRYAHTLIGATRPGSTTTVFLRRCNFTRPPNAGCTSKCSIALWAANGTPGCAAGRWMMLFGDAKASGIITPSAKRPPIGKR